MDTRAEWSKIALGLKEAVGKDAWASWFSALEPRFFSSGRLTLAAPNSFVADWVVGNYGHLLSKFNLVLSEATTTPLCKPEGLQSSMKIENFVVGASNRLAFEVAARLEKEVPYTPLCIDGQPGMGKTHLLHAVGWKMVSQGKKVVYLSSDKFLQGFVRAVREGRVGDFTESITACDALLFDDLQFIVGKERTQEEFFRIFDMMVAENKPLLIAADRFTFAGLDPRTKSRLGSGMAATIHPPDQDLKFSLLRFWEPSLPTEVCRMLAQLRVSVRELRGALTRVMVRARYSSMSITLVEEVLRDLVCAPPTPTPELVMEKVVDYGRKVGISREELVGRSRGALVTAMRQVFMHLAHEFGSATPAQIGKLLGGRDPSTVRHGMIQARRKVEEGGEVARVAAEVKKSLLLSSCASPASSL